MASGRRKYKAEIVFAITLNVILVCCVILSVSGALGDAKNASFSQNTENVRTLTNASANKVKLELEHRSQQVKTVSGYINGYDGIGMTQSEISAFFDAFYGSQDTPYTWQLVDNIAEKVRNMKSLLISTS